MENEKIMQREKRFAFRIEEILKASGVSKEKFAYYFGLSVRELERILNGKREADLEDLGNFIDNTGIDELIITDWIFKIKLNEKDKNAITKFFRNLK